MGQSKTPKERQVPRAPMTHYQKEGAYVRACARLYNTDVHKTLHGDVLKSRPTRNSALSSRGGEPPPSTRRSRERRTNCRSPGPYNFIKVEQKTLGHDLPLRDREWIDELHTGG